MGEGDLVEACHGQRQEGGDPVLEVLEGLDERLFLFDVRTLDCRGILDAPMGRGRMAGPDRTALARGAVADGEDEVHRGRIRSGELVPALRAKAVRRVVKAVEHLQGEWIDDTLGLAASRESVEAAGAVLA